MHACTVCIKFLGVALGTLGCDRGSENGHDARVHHVHKVLEAGFERVNDILHNALLDSNPTLCQEILNELLHVDKSGVDDHQEEGHAETIPDHADAETIPDHADAETIPDHADAETIPDHADARAENTVPKDRNPHVGIHKLEQGYHMLETFQDSLNRDRVATYDCIAKLQAAIAQPQGDEQDQKGVHAGQVGGRVFGFGVD